MFRRVVVAVALLAAVPAVRAADAPLADGNWKVNLVLPTGESTVCILKVETKDGRTTATVLASRPNVETTIRDFNATPREVSFTVQGIQAQPGGGRGILTQKFVGHPGKDHKQLLGSLGSDLAPRRARLALTEEDKVAAATQAYNDKASAAYARATQLQSRPLMLQFQAQRETDAQKKADMLKQVADLRKEVTEKLPGLLREVVEQHPDTQQAAESALTLLRMAAAAKVTADEGAKLVRLIQAQAEPYGPRFVKANALQVAEVVAGQKGLAAVAVPVLGPLVKALTDADKVADQVKVLSLYRDALAAAGRSAESKAVDARLSKMEAKLDQEYLASVPPFKPEAFAGRKDKDANKVAVLELFTGAQCPPCVAADVAFDALHKAYPSSDLVLIQYHMHIPGPDPLTNPECIARWDYYRGKFPSGIQGTPSTVFNGKPAAGGGGGMANAERKFDQYRGLIDPILEQTSPIKLTGKAFRAGDTIEIAVEVTGADPKAGDLKLRLLVVEETVKYPGGNGLRFHHFVVRSMPGGVAGTAIKEGTFRHTTTANVGEIKKAVEKYVADFAENTRAFNPPAREPELKQLKVIALIQDDKSYEILQAAQLEVGGGQASGAGGR